MTNRPRWQRLALVGCIGALLCLWRVGRPALWEPDEGRYAEIAREMLVSGDYLTPRDDWVRYFEKPPLMYWLTAASIRVLGPSEFAVRLPSALFSVGQMLIAALLSEAMFGPRAALPAALCLGLSPLFFAFARFLTLDPALAFFVSAGLAAFYFGLGEGALTRWRARRCFVLAALCAALGTLAKGPVALFLVVGAALVYMLVDGQMGRIRQIPWLTCALAYAAVALPWFVLVARRNPQFTHFFIVHEHIQRYLESEEHSWGLWFLPTVALTGAWPWVCFAPFALTETADGARAPERSSLKFLAAWFFCVIVFFSGAHSKLGSYVLPAMPPLAIVAGYGAVRARCHLAPAWQRLAHVLAAFNAALALGALAAAIALALCAADRAQALVGFAELARIKAQPLCADPVLGHIGREIAASIAALGAGAALLMGAGRGAWRQHAAIAAAACATAAMVLLVRTRDDAAALGSYRRLARAVQAPLDSGCVLASYRHFVQSLPFYTRAREALVSYRGELDPFSRGADAQASFIDDDTGLAALWRSPRCVILIADRRYLPDLAKLLSPAPRIVAREGRQLALCNQSAACARPQPTGIAERLLPQN